MKPFSPRRRQSSLIFFFSKQVFKICIGKCISRCTRTQLKQSRKIISPAMHRLSALPTGKALAFASRNVLHVRGHIVSSLLQPASGSLSLSTSSYSPPSSVRRHHERRLLRYTADEVFNIVADVSSYSSFVPWCKQSTVLSRTGPSSLTAELVVGFGLFKEKYTSEVVMSAPKSVVATSKQVNLLEFLRTEWTFTPTSDPSSCWVTFNIDFKFKSDMYTRVSDLFLQEVVDNMVAAFESRCKSVYGNKRGRRKALEVRKE